MALAYRAVLPKYISLREVVGLLMKDFAAIVYVSTTKRFCLHSPFLLPLNPEIFEPSIQEQTNVKLLNHQGSRHRERVGGFAQEFAAVSLRKFLRHYDDLSCG